MRFETHDWVRVLQFDKFYFPDLGDEGTRFTDIIAKNPGKKILFIGKPGDFPDQSRLVEIPFFIILSDRKPDSNTPANAARKGTDARKPDLRKSIPRYFTR